MSGSGHHSRVFGGKKANSVGVTFEALLRARCERLGGCVVQIPSSCRRITTPWGVKLVPIRSPFDFVLFKDGKSAAFDAKTVDKKTFAYSSIDPHQTEALCLVGEHAPAGLVIWFRMSDRVCFFNHHLVKALKPSESFKETEGIYLGLIDSFNPLIILSLQTKSKEEQILL